MVGGGERRKEEGVTVPGFVPICPTKTYRANHWDRSLADLAAGVRYSFQVGW
jgi:hypothetical protein